MQRKTLGEMLRRSGSEDIPPCDYSFPSNATQMVSLLSAFKSAEAGVHISLAESLLEGDASAAIALSSMAGVAARQGALLRIHANSNASFASFETPLSATWAYNLALGFVQPGSCPAELPIPTLPVLYLNNATAGFARPGSSVPFAWGDAGKAAASRAGKPLFIGWVNQVDAPMYTPLTWDHDGFGVTRVPTDLSGTAFAVLTTQTGLTSVDELTRATLAGPVIVCLVQ
ncbi:hypothetical protein BS50DRAFT_580186 [Corynespora cassiicola Philippines]|uniref:Uncharacterized protein n=1 Tax=Corynespora cassiicola Philippines TaxID=1448308 RepID=A0A2T2N160_CORCC|nr:hypothetical protein BS50DRAFT_580186 [Corynespora cassiicola Philippines]